MSNLVATEFLTNQHQLENPSKGKNVLKTLRFHEGALKQQVCPELHLNTLSLIGAPYP